MTRYGLYFFIKRDQFLTRDRNQVVEAFGALAKHIQAHEPKTQIYFAIRPEGTDELIIVEK